LFHDGVEDKRKESRVSDLLIEHATLIDGVADEPAEDATLVARDGRIAYVGPAAGAPSASPDARRIDGRGLTLLPGLIDAHVHLSLSSGPFDDLQRENIASVAFKAAYNAWPGRESSRRAGTSA
jgi:imidazolonepropionase-like amidohydrolase